MTSIKRPLCLIAKNASQLFRNEIETSFRLINWGQIEGDNSHLKKEVEGAFLVRAEYPKEWRIEELPNLKVVTNHGAGVNHIDFKKLNAMGIRVSNTPGVIAPATADIAIGLIIALGRRLKEICFSTPFGPESKEDSMMGFDINGATLGIVGLGGVGTEVALRASGFRMKILYYQRTRNMDKEAELKAKYCSTLEELLSKCDFVVLTCPLTNETHHLMGKNQFEQMKRGSYLINVSRGAVVDTEALVSALDLKLIAGAGLDVTQPEPLPAGHTLYDRPNVFLTPHIGTHTVQARHKMSLINKEEMLIGLRGETMKYETTGEFN